MHKMKCLAWYQLNQISYKIQIAQNNIQKQYAKGKLKKSGSAEKMHRDVIHLEQMPWIIIKDKSGTMKTTLWIDWWIKEWNT